MKETKDLNSFLKSKAASKTNLGVELDWDARKDKWLTDVNNLYALIKKWLRPLEKDETLSFLTAPIAIQEEYIGSYQIESLSIRIGKQRVSFIPKGALIIGAEGRVDIRGHRAIRTIIVNDGKWFIVNRSPKLKTFPFTEDSFQDALQEVML